MLNTNTSIIDAIKAKNGDSSFSGRSALASKYGMNGYSGTSTQNTELLNLYSKDVTSSSDVASPIVTNSASAQASNINNVNQLNTLNAGFKTGQGNMVNQANVNNINANTETSPEQNINNENQKLMNEQAGISSEIKAKYETLKTNNDVLYNKTIDNINARFDSLRTTLVDTNQRFTNATAQSMYMINGFQYTPQQAESMVYQAETSGINKLQELEGERASAVIKANEAKQNDDARMLDQQMKLLSDNFDNRMKIITNMQNLAKNISSQLETSKKSQATAQASLYKDIDQIVPYYNAMSTPEQKEQFIQEYATRTGASAETIKSTLQNYTKSQLDYKKNTSTANTKIKSGTTTKTNTSSTGKTTQMATVVTEIPDTPIKREKEIKKDMEELKTSEKAMFDNNEYLVPEAVPKIIQDYVAQGYSEAEIKEALDGYVYDKEDDGFIERTRTGMFGYKR